MPRDYLKARRARLPIIRALHALGISLEWIAEKVGCCPQTLLCDLRSIRMKHIKLAKRKRMYAVVLKRYARISINDTSDAPPDAGDEMIRQYLVDWLRIGEVEHFIRGLEMAMRRLAVPEYPDHMEGYVKLIKAIFGFTWGEAEERNQDWGRLFWQVYLNNIDDGSNPAPASHRELLQDLTNRYVRLGRLDIMPVWPENAATLIDRILGTLPERQEQVVRMRFGIGRKTRTLEQVGSEFVLTRERVRQIEAKALRKLRHPSRSQYLKDLAFPFALKLHEPKFEAESVEPLPSLPLIETLAMPVENFECSIRLARCLEEMSIKRVWELTEKTEYELRRQMYFGRKSLYEVKNILADLGLTLGMQFDDHAKAAIAEYIRKAAAETVKS